MTTPEPFNITKEIDKLTSEVEQDREAGVFLGKGALPIVSELSRQLRASIRYDAINGTATERSICGSQMIRAADRLDHLEAENARLRGEIDGTNPVSANPGDWGLKAENEYLRGQLALATAKIDQLETPVEVHTPYTKAEMDANPNYPSTTDELLHLLSCYWADSTDDCPEDAVFAKWERQSRHIIDKLTAATSRAEQAVALLSHSRCLDDDQRTEAKLWRRHRDAFLGEQAARLRVEAAKNSRPVA